MLKLRKWVLTTFSWINLGKKTALKRTALKSLVHKISLNSVSLVALFANFYLDYSTRFVLTLDSSLLANLLLSEILFISLRRITQILL